MKTFYFQQYLDERFSYLTCEFISLEKYFELRGDHDIRGCLLEGGPVLGIVELSDKEIMISISFPDEDITNRERSASIGTVLRCFVGKDKWKKVYIVF